MARISEVAVNKRPDFRLLGAHPAIDFVNTLVPPPGLDIEFLQSWQDVIDWLKETKLSDGQNLTVSESDAPHALEAVRNLRRAWTTALEGIMDGHAGHPRFIKQLNEVLGLDTFSETLGVQGKKSFYFDRSRSSLEGQHLALAILARTIAEFLVTAEFKYLRRCANTDSCALVFYDTTKNHRRQWCSNATCGNRYKVAQFRHRQRATSRKQRPGGEQRNLKINDRK